MKFNVDDINKTYNVGIYIRLSREDDDKILESESITNQRELIKNYVNKNNLGECEFFVDQNFM